MGGQIMTQEKNKFVLPSKIPWENLKGKDLEECVYWLLHAMGARDLQWRIGGKGQGTSDQGRDLESTFYSSDPDGEISQQKWWLECKGRSGTVEKEAVVSAAQNLMVYPQVDILVVATNTQFSNPTLDWVKEWNAQKPKPKIRLWDRNTLERLLCDHPEVAARLFERSLSPQGRLEFVRAQFWNHAQPADASSLRIFWHQRKQLDWDRQSQIAVVVSEVLGGNVCERAWGSSFSDDQLKEVFTGALINGPGMFLRAHEHGKELRGYHEAFAYLLLNMLVRFKADSISKMLERIDNLDQSKPGREFGELVRDAIIEPMMKQLDIELRDICQNDCSRVITDPISLTEKQIESYWQRLNVQEPNSSNEEEKAILIIETKSIPCKVGFDTTSDGCPFLWDKKESMVQQLNKIQTTVLFRLRQHLKRENDPLRQILR